MKTVPVVLALTGLALAMASVGIAQLVPAAPMPAASDGVPAFRHTANVTASVSTAQESPVRKKNGASRHPHSPGLGNS